MKREEDEKILQQIIVLVVTMIVSFLLFFFLFGIVFEAESILFMFSDWYFKEYDDFVALTVVELQRTSISGKATTAQCLRAVSAT